MTSFYDQTVSDRVPGGTNSEQGPLPASMDFLDRSEGEPKKQKIPQRFKKSEKREFEVSTFCPFKKCMKQARRMNGLNKKQNAFLL